MKITTTIKQFWKNDLMRINSIHNFLNECLNIINAIL